MRYLPFILAAALVPVSVSAAPVPGAGARRTARSGRPHRTAQGPQARSADGQRPDVADIGSAGRAFPCGGRVIPYGKACAGSSGQTPKIQISGCPLLGQTFRINLSGGLAGAPGSIVFGSAGRGSVSIGGCSLYVAPPWKPVITFTLHRAAGKLDGDQFLAGTYELDVPVPANSQLVGTVLDLQATVADPGSVNGLVMSRGIEIRVGF